MKLTAKSCVVRHEGREETAQHDLSGRQGDTGPSQSGGITADREGGTPRRQGLGLIGSKHSELQQSILHRQESMSGL